MSPRQHHQPSWIGGQHVHLNKREGLYSCHSPLAVKKNQTQSTASCMTGMLKRMAMSDFSHWDWKMKLKRMKLQMTTYCSSMSTMKVQNVSSETRGWNHSGSVHFTWNIWFHVKKKKKKNGGNIPPTKKPKKTKIQVITLKVSQN